MNGIQDADPAFQPDKAKQIAASGNPQAIMAALAGQAGVDPYKVLTAVKSETDKRKMMQAQMGDQAIQQAQQMPTRTVAQELIAQLQSPTPQQQGPGFAEGGVVSTDGWNRQFWDRDSEFNDFLRFLRDNNKVAPGREVLDVQRIDPKTLQALRVEFDTSRRRINPSRPNYDWSRAIPGGPDNLLLPPQPMPALGGAVGDVAIPEFAVQEQKDPQSVVRKSSAGAVGFSPISVREKLKAPQYSSAELKLPDTVTEEQLREREDKVASKDMAEYDAVMGPLMQRRRELYEKQKASRPTRFDAALDGILGTDIRGRRLGSGLAAMATGGRRSEREAAAMAARQDEAQLQSEELMARARMEARKGNREAAARLIAAAREIELKRIDIGNRNLEASVGARNETETARAATDRFNSTQQLQVDTSNAEMRQRAAEAAANRANALEVAQMRAGDPSLKTSKFYLEVKSRLNSDPAVKTAVNALQAISALRSTNPQVYQQALQEVQKAKQAALRDMRIDPTIAAELLNEDLGSAPSGLPSNAVIHKL